MCSTSYWGGLWQRYVHRTGFLSVSHPDVELPASDSLWSSLLLYFKILLKTHFFLQILETVKWLGTQTLCLLPEYFTSFSVFAFLLITIFHLKMCYKWKIVSLKTYLWMCNLKQPKNQILTCTFTSWWLRRGTKWGTIPESITIWICSLPESVR